MIEVMPNPVQVQGSKDFPCPPHDYTRMNLQISLSNFPCSPYHVLNIRQTIGGYFTVFIKVFISVKITNFNSNRVHPVSRFPDIGIA